MNLADVLPMPFMSAWDSQATASGSIIDPLWRTASLHGGRDPAPSWRYHDHVPRPYLSWGYCQVNRCGA